ncbi:MAG: hypothetical protein M1817_000258 [Caeruleum heppii]|nr:MAG: hypothetical protein M1817_000258 [Caeruleum heppii]
MAGCCRLRLKHFFTALLACSTATAFYIPGWSIKSYRDDDPIPLHVNKVYSDNTQLQYAYYDLPFVCPPTGEKRADTNLASGHSISLNLGEVLRGDRIRTSDYNLNMGQDHECRYLCTREVDRQGLKRAKDLVGKGYVAEWIVDNLPGATRFVTVDKRRKYYAAGFKMGFKDYSPSTGQPRYYINNHVTLVLRHRKAPGKDGANGRSVIVGFEVHTKSIGRDDRNETGCPKDVHAAEEGLELYLPSNSSSSSSKYPYSSYTPPEAEDDIEDGATLSIPYTYSVYWREDDSIEWSNRWDMYFVNEEDSSKFHWLAILNSLIICGFLAICVAVILARTIKGDIQGYSKDGANEEGKIRLRRKKPLSGTRSPRLSEKGSGGLLDQGGDIENDADISSDEESLEDITGWKLLHGDVFRPPPYSGLLAPLIGSGMQLVFMAGGVLLLSCLGILNPSFRGGFISVGMGLFIFAGVFSGYFSGRVYKTLNGTDWKKNALLTGLLFPGLLFALVFILNLFTWAQASSTALPFSTLLGLAALWLGIQLPLVYVGSFYGFVRIGAYTHPTKTNAIPRQIPGSDYTTPGSLRHVAKWTGAALGAGLLPFGVIFIELLFVFKSVWQDKSGFYYVFGFLGVVGVVLGVTVVEVCIVGVYGMLCAENYAWHWPAFLLGSSSSIWIFLYSIYYYSFHLHIQGLVSGVLFFAYSALVCGVYGLLWGTVGWMGASWFVGRIYGAIKAD